MAIGSILLAILSLASTALGFLTTPIPGVGVWFSFAAPALALAGSIVGGLAMSRGKREGTPTDVARTGVILSAIVFVPALFIALFCGVCNMLIGSAGSMHMQRQVSFGVHPNQAPDASAGARALPPPARGGAPALGGGAPGTSPAPAGPPASAFPPPPLPPGPGAKQGR